MFRATLFATAVATAAAALAPMAFAGPEDDLRECYGQVIRACEAAARPGLCSEAGMQSCDEMYTAGVTLSPEVISMITRDDLARYYLTPVPDLSDVTPMPMPVMPAPEPAAEPDPEPEETAEPHDDGPDPEIEAALRLIELLATGK